MDEYAPPVDQLLKLGEASRRPAAWPDYPSQFGLNQEHVPELVRLATDQSLCDKWHYPESEGIIHALRALAQLRAADRLTELVDFIDEMERDDLLGDWVTDEMPDFLELFGLAAFPILKSELQRADRQTWVRSAASDAMGRLTRQDPELRTEVIDLLVQELEREQANEPVFNGVIVGHLLDMKAVEAAPRLEQAFANGVIDETMAGDWPDVRYELGLGPEPTRKRPNLDPAFRILTGATLHTPKMKAEKRKAQRKATKQARKRNRKSR